MNAQHWARSWNADPLALPLANRHYSRQNPNSPQFMPPGRQLVLVTLAGDAVWGTAWPYAQYVNRDWADAWLCCIFRNEGSVLSSELIREAVAITRYEYGDPPPSGMITFIDPGKVRRKRDWGRCYRKAGFTQPVCPTCFGEGCKRCFKTGKGYSWSGLLALQLIPEQIPEPLAPVADRRPARLLRKKVPR